MNQIYAEKKGFQNDEGLRKMLGNRPDRIVVDKPSIITMDSDQPVYYGRFNGNADSLFMALESLQFRNNKRPGGGMPQQSEYANSNQRVSWRNNFCNNTKFANEFPLQQGVVNQFSEELNAIYRSVFPTLHEGHLQRVSKGGESEVRNEYKIGNTPFTSTILNKDTALPCHKDESNLRGTMSVMLVLTESMIGGDLILPEYNLQLKMHDRTVVVFEGSAIAHGVTQMSPTSSGGYRYSMVNYTLSGMPDCLSLSQERELYNQRNFM